MARTEGRNRTGAELFGKAEVAEDFPEIPEELQTRDADAMTERERRNREAEEEEERTEYDRRCARNEKKASRNLRYIKRKGEEKFCESADFGKSEEWQKPKERGRTVGGERSDSATVHHCSMLRCI